MKEQKKAQVTLFVILGIVLLIVFIMALQARSVFVEEKLRAEAKSTLADYLTTNNINYYIKSCLEESTIEGIKTITELGGTTKITGTLGEDYITFIYEGEKRNTTIGLKPNDVCKEVKQQAPEYPYPAIKVSNLKNLYLKKCFVPRGIISGFLGYPTINPLCDIYGENGVDVDYAFYKCKPGDYGYEREKTIQGQLAEKIKEELTNCVNFSAYESINNNITLNEEGVKVNVTFGKGSTIITANYPFEIKYKGKKITINEPFNYETNIPLLKIFEYVYALLAKDSQEADFNITKDYQTVPGYMDGIRVKLIKDACQECQNYFDKLTNLLIIEFYNYRIKNQPIRIFTGIKERLPVLDYIHSALGGEKYDVIAIEGENITLTPKAYDPDDEGIINYTYEGWRETTTAKFNKSCCQPDETGLLCPNYEECVKEEVPEEKPRNWTKSDLYRQTKKDATISLSEEDMGPHTVTIYSYDTAGKYDFQTIKILVFDLPIANLTIDNGFEEINNTIASIEDPYILNASNSRTSMIANQEIDQYRWEGKINDERIFYISTTQPWAILPFYYQEANFNNIKEYPFNITKNRGTEHEVFLTVTAGEIISRAAQETIKVFKCLPKRNRDENGRILSWAYPYNNTNVYEYDHTCCEGTINEDGTISTADYYGRETNCYEYTEYGPILLFQERKATNNNQEIEPPSEEVRLIVNNEIIRTFDNLTSIKESLINQNNLRKYSNDVFKREMTRSCSGDRGNTCTGPITEKLILTEECSDTKDWPTQTGTCSGVNTKSIIPQQCKNYKETTFEKEIGLSTNIYCDETPRCSTETEYGITQGRGDRIARGTCDGTGGCKEPITIEICGQGEPAEGCEGTSFYQYNYYCEAGDDKCATEKTLQWTGCSNKIQPGANYCQNNQLLTCGQNEYCVTDNKGDPRCVDPCEGVDEQCINQANPRYYDITTQQPRCSITEGGPCTTEEGEQGICNSGGTCEKPTTPEIN